MTLKPCEHHISKASEENFAQFWSHVYTVSKKQKNRKMYVQVTAKNVGGVF